jgi:uncharacterized protein
MIYLDSAAIVKLVREEPESEALGVWLAERLQMPRVSSVLADVEVGRAIARHAPESHSYIAAIMDTIARFDIDHPVRAMAVAIADPLLRSLDAIHLASAQILRAEFGKAPVFVTYDKRLLIAAKAAGLPVASPGATA